MTRNALTRGLAAVAMIAAASGLLAGCGGNSSTASSKPSVSATTEAPASAPAPTNGTGSPSDEQNAQGGVNPSPTGVPPTGPPETPQPVPSGFPGPSQAPRSEKDQAFLDQLNKQGIKTGDNGDVALQTAAYICGALKSKVPQQNLDAMVGAIASSQAGLVGQKIDKQKATNTYISVAKATYCNH